ncbi:MAG: sensor histidine kinase [Alphaproteobacteria bacterium]
MKSRTDKRRLSALTGEFVDPSLERAFRVSNFADARFQNRMAVVVAAGIITFFAVFDYLLIGLSPLFYAFAGLRVATIVAVVLIFAATRRTRHIALADWSVFTYLLWLTGFFLFLVYAEGPEGSLSPPNVVSFGAVLLVLGYYVFVSIRLLLSTAAALITSILYIAAQIHLGGSSAIDAGMEASLLVGCNALGFSMLYRLQVLRRREYMVLQDARDANRRLRAKSRELNNLARTHARSRDEAVLADRSKSEFLAHMSHELRSPLNAILGFAEIMKKQIFGPIEPVRYLDYVEDIHASGSHLIAVINDILDLSKSESGKFELNETSVSLPATIEASLRLVGGRAADGSVRLSNESPTDLPEIRADERRLLQILINLLTNAVDFTPAGGCVSVGGAVREDGKLALWVADTGEGIAKSDIPRILEAYGQADVSRDRQGKGTGLGLPIAKSMMEQHGGTLDVDSAVGEGTTVMLVFPGERLLRASPGRQAAG